ncbi:MAG: hypothetical protein LW688_11975 [Cryomorphaceae bacterium]|nr:hypothetical protein [Cryomorphaceae bacterium]
MKPIILLLLFFTVVGCSSYKPTVSLANGKLVSKHKYDRMLQKAFRSAHREAKRSVIREFNRNEWRALNRLLKNNSLVDTLTVQIED